MQQERNTHIRQQAITALELTKGFTPEQRAAFSNELKTVEELAGFILELTNAQHPAGCEWVKASERLPGLKTAVKWRVDGIEMKAKALWYMVHDTNSEYLSNCEWYDESPSEPEQKEAVEFAQVLEAMEWVKMSNWGFARGIGWQVYGDPNPSKYLTTAQLYEQYLQQKG